MRKTEVATLWIVESTEVAGLVISFAATDNYASAARISILDIFLINI